MHIFRSTISGDASIVVVGVEGRKFDVGRVDVSRPLMQLE
jgi:hypothetical protein